MTALHELHEFARRGVDAQAAVDQVIADVAKAKAATKPRSLNPTRFLCRSEVREFLLHEAARCRSHKFTRVSAETLIEVNEQIRGLPGWQGDAAAKQGKDDMMIARATDQGKELLLLGLSRKNVESLIAGLRIRISRKSHGEGVPEGWTIGALW